jgi:hypothetical protein
MQKKYIGALTDPKRLDTLLLALSVVVVWVDASAEQLLMLCRSGFKG